MILFISRITVAITPRYGTALTREAVSFNKATATSNTPVFTSASTESRISRGTGRSIPLSVT